MKKVLIIITVIFCIVLGIYCYTELAKPKQPSDNSKPVIKESDPLIDYGFTSAQASLISSKTSQANINLIINEKYNKDLVYNLINEKYYLDNYFQRYYTYAQQNNKDSKNVIKDVNSQIDQTFYEDITPSDTSKGILMIVNKHYYVDSDFNGLDLVDLPVEYERYGRSTQVNRETLEHYQEMLADAKAVGLSDFLIYSAYRSYDTQTRLYNNYVSQDGQEEADTYSARPGYSEHQTGLALDLRVRYTDYFETTDEFSWLKQNAHKYGFILRYNLGEEYITGYQYEPWHFRYCGVDCATYIYENNLDFEEYYEYVVKGGNNNE